MKVHEDSTFDVQYDDGDFEAKVPREMIHVIRENNKGQSDDAKPTTVARTRRGAVIQVRST